MKLIHFDPNPILSLYSEQKSIEDISKELGLTCYIINKCIREHNVVRSVGKPKGYPSWNKDKHIKRGKNFRMHIDSKKFKDILDSLVYVKDNRVYDIKTNKLFCTTIRNRNFCVINDIVYKEEELLKYGKTYSSN